MKYSKFVLFLLILLIAVTSSCDFDILNIEKKIKANNDTVVDDEIIQYKTIALGSQIWMDKNLNIGTMIQAGSVASDNDQVEKYCYNNDTALCTIYGGLYSWEELMNYSFQEGSKGICPEGWHIPTVTDWQILINFLGGVELAGGKLKQPGTSHWKSPNIISDEMSNFNALPSGFYNSQSTTHFQGIDELTYLWSSSGNTAFSWSILLQHTDTATVILSNPVLSGLPVRCIQN
jgi:uncharacterized protein (TIGR02145 family)